MEELGNYIYLNDNENKIIPIHKNWHIRKGIMTIYSTNEIVELSHFIVKIFENIYRKYMYEIPLSDIHSVQGQ